MPDPANAAATTQINLAIVRTLSSSTPMLRQKFNLSENAVLDAAAGACIVAGVTCLIKAHALEDRDREIADAFFELLEKYRTQPGLGGV